MDSQQEQVSVKGRWVDLNMRQLLAFHALKDEWLSKGRSTDSGEYKIRLLLILLECDIVSFEYEGMPEYRKDADEKDVDDAIRYMWECVENKHRVVVLRKWGEVEGKGKGGAYSCDIIATNGTGQMMKCGWDDMMGAALELTKWMENTEGLLRLPERFISIGGEVYGLPDALLQDVSYEQYGVAQGFMTAYWGMADKVLAVATKNGEEPDGKTSNTGEGKVAISSQQTGRNLAEMAEKLEYYQRNFVAALLMKCKMEEGRWIKQPYSGLEQEKIRDRIAGEVPSALFSLMLQYVQSVLVYYKKAYPHLFKSGGSGKKQRNTLVAEQGVIIGLMQEGGFNSIEAVRQAEVGLVFKALDMMQEKAEETKKALDKAKRGKGK